MRIRGQLHTVLIAIGSVFLTISFSGAQTISADSIVRGANFDKIAVTSWIAGETKKIKGIVLLVPGSNGDGRKVIYDTAWQNLARRHDFALAGCYLTDKEHENMAIEHYVDVDKGSGKAFLDILTRLSKKSRHPELATAPLILFGVSAGGQFNYEFACWKPERVIAFVVNKGGIYYSSLAPPAAWEIPAIFFVGEKDSPFRNNIVKGIFSMNRRFGAKWMLAEEPHAAHDFEASEIFARKWFDQIIPLRLNQNSQGGMTTLQTLPDAGFIGIQTTKEIMSIPEKKPTEITSWFPTKQMAEAWVIFTQE